MYANIDDKKLKEILLSESYVTEDDVAKAEATAANTSLSFVEYLINNGLLTRELLGQAIAESFKLPYVNLTADPAPKELILKVPEATARELRIVLVEEGDNILVATDSPSQNSTQSLQKLFPGQIIKLAYALPDDIESAFVNYQKPLETRFSQILTEHRQVAPEILEEIMADALTFNASDIHFEPQGVDVVVRFRVDGVIHEAGRLPKDYYGNVLNRIKVQSHLRIDEHFSTQDGAMRFEKGNQAVDLRTSIVPTVEGEKIVLRLLSSYSQGLGMSNLGLSETHASMLSDASRKPFGMILVVGPTGSGKTTTLYSVLNTLNQPNVNITTIEDPVEYRLKGINQIQVNLQTDLTFEKGLRSIVRQDPDIILVGEIRDDITAEISINAALTGHLLLSTFHANDAASAIPRLLDMNIEPFLLASTMELVMAQRLVRKLCNQCRFSTTITRPQLEETHKGISRFFEPGNITLYSGKGCNACSGTGYKGRTAIFEFIKVTPAIENLMLTNPSAQQIWQLAAQEGSRSMFEDGIEKVKSGVTTLEELLRVSAPPDVLHQPKAKKTIPIQ